MKHAAAVAADVGAGNVPAAICLGVLTFCLMSAPAQATDACVPSGEQRIGAGVASWFKTVYVGPGAERIDGSGKLVERERAVSAFDALRVSGPISVRLAAGANESLKIRADDNIEPLVEVRIDGRTLSLGFRRGTAFRSRTPVEVLLAFRELQSVAVAGSGAVMGRELKLPKLNLSVAGNGDILLDRIEVEELKGTISGSGDICASGRAEQQQFAIAGSGDIRADKLQGRSAKVKIAGSGDARIAAVEELSVSIAGSGDVVYLGSPRLTKSIAGSGNVAPMRP
jgi:hypothetical protein